MLNLTEIFVTEGLPRAGFLVLWSDHHIVQIHKLFINTPWSESASELYRPSNRRLSAK
jgi:hypothetical protein